MASDAPVTLSEDQPITVYASKSGLASKAGRAIADELEHRGMNVKRQGTVTLSSGRESVTMTEEQFDTGTREVLGDFPAPIPLDSDFASLGVDFLPAEPVEEIAERLIADYPEFEHLQETEIAYAWKAKGGESSGQPVFGKCVKASGLVKFFSDKAFVIWIAADNCREWGFTNEQLEALIYHELCHAGEKEDKDGNPKAVLYPHDVELFAAEVTRYGLWHEGLRRVKPAFDQCELPGFGG